MSDGEDRVMGMEDEVRDESGNGERKQRMRGTRERQSTQLCDGEEKTPRPKTLIYPSLLL